MKTLALLLAIVVAACSNGTAKQPAAAAKVSSPVPAVAPAPPEKTAKGTVETKRFKSEALGVEKDYVIYLPAGYEAKPDTRWPVFYYLHGLTGDETNWTKLGKIENAADELGIEAIIVMPDGDDGWYVDGVAKVDYDACMKDGTGLFQPGRQAKRNTCVRSRNYSTYIVKDLVGHVDATYRTIAKREGRAIAGLSMGGFGALQLSMRHPELFAAAASHSGVDSLIYGGPFPYAAGKVEIIKDVKRWGGPFVELNRWMRGMFGDDMKRWKAHDPTTLVESLEPGTLALYLDCGTEDGFMLQHGAAWLHDLLLARKIDHVFYLGPGDHTFSFWAKRVYESLKFLRDNTQKPT